MSLVQWYVDGECVETNTTLFPEAEDDCCEPGLAFRVALQRTPGYLIMSLVLLLYVFLGVALGADVFMTSIEMITSKEKQVTVSVGGEKKIFHTQVWNATVANLTLMALGSSAPEILLNVVDVFKLNYFSGELGPSTIVGSAAFNLMVISAVCIVALPAGESRTLNQMPVFITTAAWSVGAYIWLIVILKGSSPDIIEVWEAVLTCAFLPLLVLNAYLVDVHWGDAKRAKDRISQKIIGLRGKNIHHGEIMDEIKSRQKGTDAAMSPDALAAELAADFIPKTRGDYRRSVIAAATGSSNAARGKPGPSGEAAAGGANGIDMKVIAVEEKTVVGPPPVAVGFTRRVVACIEGVDHTARLVVRRQGELQGELRVRIQTEERGGGARAGTHFQPVDTTLVFAPGAAEVTQEVHIVDNAQVDDDVYLVVALSEPQLSSAAPLGAPGDASAGVVLGGELQFAECRVQIQDDDKNPGCFRWHTERVEVMENVGTVNLTVLRTGGLNGEVTIKYATKDQTANAGKDYVAASGTLRFPHGTVSQSLTLEIVDDDTYEKDETFTIVLSEPTGGATFDKNTDGGADAAVCTVVILNDDEITSKLEEVIALLRINADSLALAREDWAEALRDAIFPLAGATPKEKAVHFLNVPWKLMFAIVPPPGMCGGVPCFFGALIMIGVQVVLISDFAGLMGCQMNLKPAVTAITFVALGTSLPDTFASMAAARGDKYADNSVGNVTGSNSVNVFLGLGLAWLICAVYWEGGADAEWLERYPEIAARQRAAGKEPGGFVVEAGDLGFSVVVFTVCAILTIALILYRRPHELGGDRRKARAHAALLCLLWVIYVVLSALSAYRDETGFSPPF